MMSRENGIWSEREQAIEANYFRHQDHKLIEKLRQGSKLDEIAMAVRDKLDVDNVDLLDRVRALGVTADTAAAFLLAPLIKVAWASGLVTRAEREAVLRHARERGVQEGTPADSQLVQWLDNSPDERLFETSIEVINYTLAVLPRYERDERIERIINACRDVAKASASKISWLFGVFDPISRSKASVLGEINNALRPAGPRVNYSK